MQPTTQSIKPEHHNNLSVINNLYEKRKREELRNKRVYYFQHGLHLLRNMAIIAIGVWCYSSRYSIQEYIVNFISQMH
jgi:hypothetical protein